VTFDSFVQLDVLRLRMYLFSSAEEKARRQAAEEKRRRELALNNGAEGQGGYDGGGYGAGGRGGVPWCWCCLLLGSTLLMAMFGFLAKTGSDPKGWAHPIHSYFGWSMDDSLLDDECCEEYEQEQVFISLLMSPLLGHRPSLWITHKEGPEHTTRA
jgi:hypothetical protein